MANSNINNKKLQNLERGEWNDLGNLSYCLQIYEQYCKINQPFLLILPYNLGIRKHNEMKC